MCSSKGNLKRNNYQNDIMLSFSRLLPYTQDAPVDYVPTLNWLLDAGPVVLFSWHLSCLHSTMTFICFSCQIQIWIVFQHLSTSNQIIETRLVRGLLIIWRIVQEHANRNKKTGGEHYCYPQIPEGLSSERHIIFILLTPYSLTRTNQVLAQKEEKDQQSQLSQNRMGCLVKN